MPRAWSELPEPARQIFQALRSLAGEQMTLEQNALLEANLTTRCRAWPMQREFTARGRSCPQEGTPDEVG